MQDKKNGIAKISGAVWGIAGIIMLLASAIFRLAPYALEAFNYNFLWYHWLALIFNTIFMLGVKGYLGFHKGFSPRVAARAKYLKDNYIFMNSILAPLFCMGYFKSSLKRKISAISLTIAIVILIILIRKLPQPWRGIVDFGVVAGLIFGIISLIIFGYKALSNDKFDYANEVI
ncbi:MAG: hypothetical protein HY934_06330 [Candidatus Firestonebacteria bacterium]|nr:hypothetical protein [Candidatus Firestonebacteria bacterium]